MGLTLPARQWPGWAVFALAGSALLLTLLTAGHLMSGNRLPYPQALKDLASPADGQGAGNDTNSTVIEVQTPDHIPNIAHFVYIKAKPDEDIKFKYKEFLSIYSAYYHWRPDTIYFHTNVDEFVLARCRQGFCGKWTKLVLTAVPNLVVRYAEPPQAAGNGHEIKGMEHRSDFVRVQAANELGGVYMDLDAFALRDVRDLRESGFASVCGREITRDINSGVWMTRAHSRLISLWEQHMNRVYDGAWLTHSNHVLRNTAEWLAAQPGEALIMEYRAFAPYGWGEGDRKSLFLTHEDVPSMIENVGPDRKLPDLPLYYSSYVYDRWEQPPGWYQSLTTTWILHSFSSDRNGNGVDGFEGITPRLTLDARTNFGIALYPVARHLFENGLIEIDDSRLPEDP